MISPNNNFDLLKNIIPYKIVKLKNDDKFYVMVSMFKDNESPLGKHILFAIDNKLDPNYEGNEIYEYLTSQEQQTYTIIFKDGEEIVKTITGEPGTYVSVPHIEKEGYEFIGWSIDGINVTMPVDGIGDSDITYIAIFVESSDTDEAPTIDPTLVDESTDDESTDDEPTEEDLGTDIIVLDDQELEDLSYIKIKDIENINYFIFKNESLSEEFFDEDELKSLNQTFMKIIIDYSDKYDNVKTPIDFLYKAVIDFYANGQYDDATVLMNSIFGTPLTTTTINNGCNCSTTSSCSSSSSSTATSINTGTTSVPVDTATCIEKYTAAMYQWLIKMLSDIDFYCNWMTLDLAEDGSDLTFNDVLIDKLINLLTQFVRLGFDLSNLNGKNCTDGCNCGHTLKYGSRKLSNGNNANDCSDILNNAGAGISAACSNYKIIENYIKVLNWVKNNEINENKNKIYIYGKQFAEIFPLLNF